MSFMSVLALLHSSDEKVFSGLQQFFLEIQLDYERGNNLLTGGCHY